MLDRSFFTHPLTHRTLHDVTDGRPENSIAGTHAAIDAGYGIEIDVQLSRDGVPMVFHDDTLDRLTNETGPVCKRSAAELAMISLLGGSEGIPTLAAFLEMVSGRVPLLIEIKDQDGSLGPDTQVLEFETCAQLNAYQGPTALMSFNPHSIALCAKFAPSIPRGLVTDEYNPKEWHGIPVQRLNELRAIPDYDRVGACFISHHHTDLSSKKVADLRVKGAHIFCWTVTSPEQERIARQYADNITFERYLAPHPDPLDLATANATYP